MLIGVDARSLLQPHPRGEGKTLLRLYQELKRIRPDWRVKLYGERPAPAEVPRLFDVRSRSVPGFRWNTWERFALPAFAALDRVDLLHCSSSSAPPVVGRPFVLTVHDIIPLMFDDGQSAEQARRFEETLLSALRRANAVIAVSDHTKRDLVGRFGIDAARVHVIHWGTEALVTESELPPPSAVGGEQFILAFGGDAPRKNTERALRAFALAAERAPGARLALVGLAGARTRDDLERLAASLGVAGRVDFHGYVSEADLSGLYRRASLLFYPSLYEGFGMPIVEAMAHGMPIVTSNTTSIPEVIGGAGVLVDPTDVNGMAATVAEVLADPRLRDGLRQRALQRAREFSWEVCARKTAEVFERALS